jgi:outer membrane protein assembly factor BamB
MWRTNGSSSVRWWAAWSMWAVGVTLALAVAPVAAAASPGDWTTFAHDSGHSGFDSAETAITPTTAAGLKLAWTRTAGGVTATQPVIAGNVVYWGSWDGYEHATNATTGAIVWARFLGTTTSPCGAIASPFGPLATGTRLGVNSTATLATIGSTPMLFVGGGDRQIYALNPLNGAVIWHTLIYNNANAFIWASPVALDGNVYIGSASISDCPLVAGKITELSGATGAILHTFAVVPNGCIGAGVWGTPAIDTAAGTLYFTTGNSGSCARTETYAESIVELRTSNLSFVHHWQVPASQRIGDGDFGATPTLFTATINGAQHRLVGAANKNGIFYAWDRANINAGPVWQLKVAVAGACPQCGQGSIAPAAWDGARLYVAGGNTTITGRRCKGGVRALNPARGSILWQHCMQSGPVLGPLTAVPGLVAATEANWLIVMDSANGPTRFRFAVADGKPFYGGASVSNGQLYVGNSDGSLLAFRP